MRRLLRDRAGASAAEFALVLPMLILLLFGVIDVGRWLWLYNMAEKATQEGARFAAVTNPVSSAVNAKYVGACSPPLTQGDNIPADCAPTITCTASSCTGGGTLDTTAFNNIVARMQLFLPDLTANDVVVQYTPSGLGYAGNPNGPDISPIITVRIGDPDAGVPSVTFEPIISLLLFTMDMPSFTTSLTAEDLNGSSSN